MTDERTLYGYFRSSAAYRLRIALNLKGLSYESVSVHLRRGDQREPGFREIQPQGFVPVLLDRGETLIQSPAILEYLDEAYPDTPPLLPPGIEDRARVRAIANIVCCDIHPVNNLRILKYIRGPLGHSEDEMINWYNQWIADGFSAIEGLLAEDSRTGTFVHGDVPGYADACLIPQIFNAFRHDMDLGPYPTIMRIWEAGTTVKAVADAHPDVQPDAEA